SPADARLFVERAMSRFGVPLEARKAVLLAHVDALEAGLRERLAGHDLTGSVRLATAEPAPSGTALLTRTHPLAATLAEALVEASLDPETLSGLGIGRVGAWPTAAAQQMTRVALLRVRFKLTVHARKERLLLAEEAALVAIEGVRIVAVGEAARELLNAPAMADLAPVARDRFIAKAKEDLPGLLEGQIAEFVRSRAQELMRDHARLRAASGSASRVTVEAVLPPDVIGLFVLMPGEA
ncbi:MAG: helicase, partial [Rhizobiales bacterium]|nr:helicase [Hyphomicrobiales bacterium]